MIDKLKDLKGKLLYFAAFGLVPASKFHKVSQPNVNNNNNNNYKAIVRVRLIPNSMAPQTSWVRCSGLQQHGNVIHVNIPPPRVVCVPPATEAVNTCYITSTYSTCSVEEIVAAAPNGFRWFQLYVYRDRKLSEQIVARVEALGYKALVLTVDVPYTGKRRNDIRNQFRLPPHLKVKNLDGMFQVTVRQTPDPTPFTGVPCWGTVFWDNAACCSSGQRWKVTNYIYSRQCIEKVFLLFCIFFCFGCSIVLSYILNHTSY